MPITKLKEEVNGCREYRGSACKRLSAFHVVQSMKITRMCARTRHNIWGIIPPPFPSARNIADPSSAHASQYAASAALDGSARHVGPSPARRAYRRASCSNRCIGAHSSLPRHLCSFYFLDSSIVTSRLLRSEACHGYSINASSVTCLTLEQEEGREQQGKKHKRTERARQTGMGTNTAVRG